jgi:hypothetical protein
MARRKTIGESPLDAVVPKPPPPKEEGPQTLATLKERVTFQLPVDLIERARNAVFWTPGLTMAALAEEAFKQALDRMEKQRGEVFPPRHSPLKTGRPVK